MKLHARQRDLLSSFLLLGLSAALWFYTESFPDLGDGYPGPALFPRVIAIALAGCGAMLLVTALRRGGTTREPLDRGTGQRAWRLLVGLVLVGSYPVLIGYIHFIPLMAGLIILFGLLLNSTSWHALLTALLSAGIIYLLFSQLLGVQL